MIVCVNHTLLRFNSSVPSMGPGLPIPLNSYDSLFKNALFLRCLYYISVNNIPFNLCEEESGKKKSLIEILINVTLILRGGNIPNSYAFHFLILKPSA